jgi:type II secretory pathway component PulF
MRLRDLMKTSVGPGILSLVMSPFGFGSRWYRQQRHRNLRAVLSQLEAIVRVNAPLPEGLLKCAMDAPNPWIASTLQSLSDKIDLGMSLADAMGALGSRFPAYVVAEVRAGESAGRLGDALRSLGEGINERLSSGRDLRNHTMYIGLLLIAELAIVTFLAFKVFPVFIEILSEFGVESRSPVVRILDWFSTTLREHTPQILFVLVIAGAVALILRVLYAYVGAVQSIFFGLLWLLPFARNLYRNHHLNHIARALELRVRGGTPLPQTLRETAHEDFPHPYRNMLNRCAGEVERGGTLSAALAHHRWTAGPAVPEIVRLGEAREDLGWAFAEIGWLTGRAVRRSGHVWAQALVPIGVGICAIGVILATVGSFTLIAGMGDAIIADL